MSSLQEAVREKLFNEVIYPHRGKEQKANGTPREGTSKESQWKVLVLDKLATRMVSACCKMHEIMAEGITLVEDLTKLREPLRSLDAIYLITPTTTSINQMLSDFTDFGNWTYRAAHVYFTEACPEELFNNMCKHPATKHKAIKTLKEINIAFLPTERRVFSLDCPSVFKTFYSPDRPLDRSQTLERVAEQIATLCATLGEFPAIRYRSLQDKNGEFAQFVLQKLEAYKADDPSMGDGPNKERSQLILLDRGYDPVSPLLHELSFQAMAYDLLDIVNDVYTYTPQGDDTKTAILDESDPLWVELRHQHIASVSQKVTARLKQFANEKRIFNRDDTSVKDVSKMVKQMPQYQKELARYATHMHLAEDCMTEYQTKFSKLCKVEQDLAMGTDHEGERIKDPMRSIVPILLDTSVLPEEKIRVMLLYILYKGGLSDENLTKLIQHASIPEAEKAKIFNLQHLGINIVQDGSRRKPYTAYQAGNRKERISEHTYQMSRWTPYLKDIMEEACEDKLDQKTFPYLSGANRGGRGGAAPVSARTRYNWTGRSQPRTGPRLIFFVLGGITHSETRAAYEVAEQNKGWDILVGSTHIITPNDHLNNLHSLTAPPETNPDMPVITMS